MDNIFFNDRDNLELYQEIDVELQSIMKGDKGDRGYGFIRAYIDTTTDELHLVSEDPEIGDKAIDGGPIRGHSIANVEYDTTPNHYTFTLILDDDRKLVPVPLEKGERGYTGNGIDYIEQIGEHTPGTMDTYIIHFTDGTTYEYEVYNGSNGLGSVSKVNNIDPIGGNVTLDKDHGNIALTSYFTINENTHTLNIDF